MVLTDGSVTYNSPLSYLHDSLGELAQMAIDLNNGCKEAKTVFIDKPDELQFVLCIKEKLAQYEARWYNAWASLNMHPQSNFKTVFSGECSPTRIIQQTSRVLWILIKYRPTTVQRALD